MNFRTIVDIDEPDFSIHPFEKMLFLGSCFAANIGQRFRKEQFKVTLNPYGVMYNPASILHSVRKIDDSFAVVFFTLGTNHVYIFKETGEIVDNCNKRPAALFQEKELTIDECADYLSQAVELVLRHHSQTKVVMTVSPYRYRKYGFHGSNLSKSVLLLATEKLMERYPSIVSYFPAFEIVNDELRDYRFYKEDMLHVSDQAVEYIWRRFAEQYFDDDTNAFLSAWKPIREALHHRPFNPQSEAFRQFKAGVKAKIDALKVKYPELDLEQMDSSLKED